MNEYSMNIFPYWVSHSFSLPTHRREGGGDKRKVSDFLKLPYRAKPFPSESHHLKEEKKEKRGGSADIEIKGMSEQPPLQA